MNSVEAWLKYCSDSVLSFFQLCFNSDENSSNSSDGLSLIRNPLQIIFLLFLSFSLVSVTCLKASMSGQFFSRSDIIKTAERRKERRDLLEKRKQQSLSRESRDSAGSPPPEFNDFDGVSVLTPPASSSIENPLETASSVTSSVSSLSSASTVSSWTSSQSSTPSTVSTASTVSSTVTVQPKKKSAVSSKTSKQTSAKGPSPAVTSTHPASAFATSATTSTASSKSVTQSLSPAPGLAHTAGIRPSLTVAVDPLPPPIVPGPGEDYEYWAPVDTGLLTPVVSFSWSTVLSMPGQSTSTSTPPPTSPPSTSEEVDRGILDRLSKFGAPASRAQRSDISRTNSTPTRSTAAEEPPAPVEPEPASAEDEPIPASVLSRVSSTFGPPAKRRELLGILRTNSLPDASSASPSTSATPEPASTEEDPECPVLSRVSNTFGPAAKRSELVKAGTSASGPQSITTQTSVADSDSSDRASAASPEPEGATAAVEESPEEAAPLLVGKSSAPYLKHFKKKKLPKSAQEADATPPPELPPPSVTEPEVMPPPTSPPATATTSASDLPTPQTAPTPYLSNMSNRTEAINRSRKTTCPNEKCKALNSYLSFKCIACQTKLGQLVNCKGCGSTVNETAGHCGKCGAGVATKSEIANAPIVDPKTQDAGAGVMKCPQPGCKTITHPSWKFCSSCGKNLKPHGPETMGPPAHLAKLNLESADSADKMEVDEDAPPPLPEELINASIAGNTRKIIDLILRGVDVNVLDEHGISSLNYACWNDRFNVVRVLSAFDADLNLRESRGYTALHAACDRSKSEELMEYLVRHGAELLGRGDMGESILHHAAAGGNVNGINFAIRHGIEVNDRDNEGATPLSYAALCDDIAPLEYLLSNGAEINAKRNNGQTILHRAVQYRKTACLQFAIEKGLKVCDRDDEGHSAIDIAYSTRAPQKIISFLREAFRTELERCSFCEDAPAHIQFHPCHHQYACGDCCTRWKKCKCGKPIEKKVDVILDTKGESGKVTEDESIRIAEELAQLQLEREKFNEEKTCAVCMDRAKAIVFDCGHTSCQECSVKMRLCHSCRKPIAKKIKFY